MKKTSILSLILIPLFSAAVYGIEINAGGGLLLVSNYYNYGITLTLGSQSYTLKEFEALMKNAGYSSEIEETGAAPAINIMAASKYNELFYYYVRLMFVPNVMYKAVYTIPGGTFNQNIDMPLVYFGGGLGAQISPMQKLHLMAQVDIGYTLMNASITQEIKDTTGAVLNTDSTKKNGSTVGYFVGAAAKYYFSGMFYGLADINYNSLGSSVFIGVGVGVDFSPPEASGSPSETAGDAGTSAAGLESEGDALYRAKNFKGAFAKYKQAMALEKKAALYVKAGNCYYALGYKAQALNFYNYSLKLEDNPGVRAFIQKISVK